MKKLITAYLDQIMFLIDETPYFPFFTSLFVCILVIFWKRSRAGGLKSPPGPWKLPVLGNLHQMVGRLPHHTLRDLAKKHGPIMYLKLGQLDAVIISSAKGAREVLKTHELTFAQRPKVWAAEVISFGQSSSIFAPYGDLWRSLRKICVFELLSATRVQSFRSVREEEVWNLIESIGSMSHEGLAINFRDRCCSFTSGVVSKAAFGKKCKDQKEFLSLLDEVNKLASGFDIPDLFPSLSFLGFINGSIPTFKDIKSKLNTILERIINDHKIKSNDKALEEEENFVDVLLKLKESNKVEFNFTTNHIKDMIMDMFFGGSETSATTLEWAMSELMRSPRVMGRAQAEVRQLVLRSEGKKNKVIEERDVQTMDYLKSVVKETLRLHSPVPLLTREARDTVQIGGFEVQVKSKVIINAWAIGRDPEAQCKGEKVVQEKKVLEVIVEKGMQNGQRITFPGEADEAPDTVTGDIVFVLQQKEHPKFKRKGDDLFFEHTLSLMESLCGFQFILTHLDGRQLLIKSHPGEVVKPDQFKAINDEGLPMYQRPFMKGKLYIHFTVEFPDSLNPEQCKALETVLPPRTSAQLTDMELDECEETTLHDVNIEEEMRRKQAHAQEAYDEDEDMHGGAQRVQCAQQ